MVDGPSTRERLDRRMDMGGLQNRFGDWPQWCIFGCGHIAHGVWGLIDLWALSCIFNIVEVLDCSCIQRIHRCIWVSIDLIECEYSRMGPLLGIVVDS